jgi:hypothetical protein
MRFRLAFMEFLLGVKIEMAQAISGLEPLLVPQGGGHAARQVLLSHTARTFSRQA